MCDIARYATISVNSFNPIEQLTKNEKRYKGCRKFDVPKNETGFVALTSDWFQFESTVPDSCLNIQQDRPLRTVTKVKKQRQKTAKLCRPNHSRDINSSAYFPGRVNISPISLLSSAFISDKKETQTRSIRAQERKDLCVTTGKHSLRFSSRPSREQVCTATASNTKFYAHVTQV